MSQVVKFFVQVMQFDLVQMVQLRLGLKESDGMDNSVALDKKFDALPHLEVQVHCHVGVFVSESAQQELLSGLPHEHRG